MNEIIIKNYLQVYSSPLLLIIPQYSPKEFGAGIYLCFDKKIVLEQSLSSWLLLKTAKVFLRNKTKKPFIMKEKNTFNICF